MGHKGPVLRHRCILPGRTWTQIPFNSVLFKWTGFVITDKLLETFLFSDLISGENHALDFVSWKGGWYKIVNECNIEIFCCKCAVHRCCLRECVFFVYNSTKMWFCVCSGTYIAVTQIMGTPTYHIIHSCYITLFPQYVVTTWSRILLEKRRFSSYSQYSSSGFCLESSHYISLWSVLILLCLYVHIFQAMCFFSPQFLYQNPVCVCFFICVPCPSHLCPMP